MRKRIIATFLILMAAVATAFVAPCCKLTPSGEAVGVDWSAVQMTLQHASGQMHDLALIAEDPDTAAELDAISDACLAAAQAISMASGGTAEPEDVYVALEGLLAATDSLMESGGNTDARFTLAAIRAACRTGMVLARAMDPAWGGPGDTTPQSD
jgi:hypothetical protein